MAAVPIELVLFAGVLALVALAPRASMHSALGGALLITLYTLGWGRFGEQAGLAGLLAHVGSEWVGLANLLALLLGFAVLARHFEQSQLPARLPDYLPDDWTGPLVLLLLVFVMSSFLDNIAAAIIGGSVARSIFRDRVHIGYLVAIVAASNAGGAGSVVGDTTTTMLWLGGVAPGQVLHAYVAAGVALLVCAVPAARWQQAYSPILRDGPAGVRIDGGRLAIVAAVLLAAVAVNIALSLHTPAWRGPYVGAAVWSVLLLSAAWRRPDWQVLPGALRGAVFLLALVWSASLMPVQALPPASWPLTLGLGLVSAGFDNIPLTALALRQGGFDWGYLAYAVGFGGSMLWFGSSAGVALCGQYPAARSVRLWLRHGWPVALAYVAGFGVMLALLGWHPDAALLR